MIAYLIAGVAALAIISGLAYKTYEAGADSIRTEWAAANEEARKREAAASAKAAADLEAERKKRKVVVKERTVFVDREIEKLVTSASCFSPDGVRTLNCAIDGTSAAGCKPDGAVPASKPAG